MEFQDYIEFSLGPTMIQRDSVDSLSLGLAIIGIASAALCVWLAVRIVNRRERWAMWTAVMVGLPVIYVAGFGPACWLTDDDVLPIKVTGNSYRPLIWVSGRSSLIRSSLWSYAVARGRYSMTGWRLLKRPWPPHWHDFPNFDNFEDYFVW
jgi:hypothetical protein